MVTDAKSEEAPTEEDETKEKKEEPKVIPEHQDEDPNNAPELKANGLTPPEEAPAEVAPTEVAPAKEVPPQAAQNIELQYSIKYNNNYDNPFFNIFLPADAVTPEIRNNGNLLLAEIKNKINSFCSSDLQANIPYNFNLSLSSLKPEFFDKFISDKIIKLELGTIGINSYTMVVKDVPSEAIISVFSRKRNEFPLELDENKVEGTDDKINFTVTFPDAFMNRLKFFNMPPQQLQQSIANTLHIKNADVTQLQENIINISITTDDLYKLPLDVHGAAKYSKYSISYTFNTSDLKEKIFETISLIYNLTYVKDPKNPLFHMELANENILPESKDNKEKLLKTIQKKLSAIHRYYKEMDNLNSFDFSIGSFLKEKPDSISDRAATDFSCPFFEKIDSDDKAVIPVCNIGLKKYDMSIKGGPKALDELFKQNNPFILQLKEIGDVKDNRINFTVTFPDLSESPMVFLLQSIHWISIIDALKDLGIKSAEALSLNSLHNDVKASFNMDEIGNLPNEVKCFLKVPKLNNRKIGYTFNTTELKKVSPLGLHPAPDARIEYNLSYDAKNELLVVTPNPNNPLPDGGVDEQKLKSELGKYVVKENDVAGNIEKLTFPLSSTNTNFFTMLGGDNPALLNAPNEKCHLMLSYSDDILDQIFTRTFTLIPNNIRFNKDKIIFYLHLPPLLKSLYGIFPKNLFSQTLENQISMSENLYVTKVKARTQISLGSIVVSMGGDYHNIQLPDQFKGRFTLAKFNNMEIPYVIPTGNLVQEIATQKNAESPTPQPVPEPDARIEYNLSYDAKNELLVVTPNPGKPLPDGGVDEQKLKSALGKYVVKENDVAGNIEKLTFPLSSTNANFFTMLGGDNPALLNAPNEKCHLMLSYHDDILNQIFEHPLTLPPRDKKFNGNQIEFQLPLPSFLKSIYGILVPTNFFPQTVQDQIAHTTGLNAENVKACPSTYNRKAPSIFVSMGDYHEIQLPKEFKGSFTLPQFNNMEIPYVIPTESLVRRITEKKIAALPCGENIVYDLSYVRRTNGRRIFTMKMNSKLTGVTNDTYNDPKFMEYIKTALKQFISTKFMSIKKTNTGQSISFDLRLAKKKFFSSLEYDNKLEATLVIEGKKYPMLVNGNNTLKDIFLDTIELVPTLKPPVQDSFITVQADLPDRFSKGGKEFILSYITNDIVKTINGDENPANAVAVADLDWDDYSVRFKIAPNAISTLPDSISMLDPTNKNISYICNMANIKEQAKRLQTQTGP